MRRVFTSPPCAVPRSTSALPFCNTRSAESSQVWLTGSTRVSGADGQAATISDSVKVWAATR